MKVLMISSDRKLFEPGSEAQKRIKEYGKLFEELHIIVFSTQLTTNNLQLTTNTWIYPTNTRFKPFYFWQAYKIGKEIIHNSKFVIHNSVITTQDPFETGLVGWLLKLYYQLPLQIQIHTDIFSPYFWQESLKNKIRVLLAKFLLPKADGIRVVSERIKNSLNSKFQIPNSKIVVLPIFVDVKKLISARPKLDLHQKYFGYDFIILMASRLSKEKNIDMAIGAMRGLTQIATRINAEKILLLIVGDGPEKEKLELQAASYKLQANVRFEPWTKDLASYYKTADVFLLTSNYEGYGRTAVEAMAAGLPVIMTDVGLVGEILVDELDGLVVPVGDKVALAHAIKTLTDDREKRASFARESQKVVNSLPDKKEYLEAYKKALCIDNVIT